MADEKTIIYDPELGRIDISDDEEVGKRLKEIHPDLREDEENLLD